MPGASGVRQALAALIAFFLLGGPAALGLDSTAAGGGAAARLDVNRGDGFVLLVVGGAPAPARELLPRTAGEVRIEAGAPFPADAAARLAAQTEYLAGAAAEGRRLRLRLAPGVAASLWNVETGELAIDLRRPPAAGPPDAAAVATTSAPVRAAAPTRSARRPPGPPVPRVAQAPEASAPPAAALAAAPAAVAVPGPAKPSGAPDVVRVEGRGDRSGAELRLAWPAAAPPAAVFERAGVLWAVFAPPAPVAVAGWDGLAGASLGGWAEPVERRQAGDLLLFRLALRRPARTEATRDGAVWRIRLAPPDGAARPAEGVARDPAGGAVRGGLPALAASLDDPLTGERLGAFLPTGAPFRSPDPERLVDLELLASAQGLAWRALADGVAASAGANGFRLDRPGGLRLSSPGADVGAEAGGAIPAPRADLEPTAVANADPAAGGGASGAAAAEVPAADRGEDLTLGGPPLGLAALGAATARERQAARAALGARLPGLPPLPRAAGRLALARLLLADALGPEARAVLQRVAAGDLPPDAAGAAAAAVAALDAAAATLGGDVAAAAALGGGGGPGGPAGDPEAALWRAYAAAGAGRPDLAGMAWERSGDALASYPTPLRTRLGLAIARSLARGGDPARARAVIDVVRPTAADPAARAELQLLRGEAAARAGSPLVAEQALAAARADGRPDTKVLAKFLLTVARHEQGALDTAAAAAELAAQRPSWRGHADEPRMLRQLSALQAEAGDAPAALASALALVERAKPGTERAEATGLARDRLAALLKAAGEGRGSPLAAAAVLARHGALLDGDPRAPALRRQVASRAAQAGLADAALGLLAAAGPEGARAEPDAATARLAAAEILIGDGDGRAGLAALAGLPAASPRGSLLRARAALQAGRPRQALDALGAVAGDAADEQRLLAWLAGGDWLGVARAAEAILARAEAAAPPRPPLGPAGASAVVWLGLARARQGEPAAAGKLTERYGDRLPPDGPWRALLDLIAATAVTGGGAAEDAAPRAQALADAVRAQLARLPPLPADAAGAPPGPSASAGPPAGTDAASAGPAPTGRRRPA